MVSGVVAEITISREVFMKPQTSTGNTIPELHTLPEAEELCHDLRSILVRSEQALIDGDAREKLEQVERWIESYRRGLSAAQKMSGNGMEILQAARDQLDLALAERLRLEDEGGNPSTKEQAIENEELARAIRRLDRLMPVIEASFHSATTH